MRTVAMTRIINMWAGPRNVSTAMMCAWNQRPDTTVMDEPMYAHYLEVTGLDHPGRGDVMSSMPADEKAVLDTMLNGRWDTPYVFIKNMAHHLEGMDTAFIAELDNFLLTRDPIDMLPSLARGFGRIPTMQDAAYADQIEILDRILESGRQPLVVDTRTLLDASEATLQALCGALDVPFDPAMLSWPEGPKDVDGVWGSHWYTRLHESTGFKPYVPSSDALAGNLIPLYNQCAPMYNRLPSYAVARCHGHLPLVCRKSCVGCRPSGIRGDPDDDLY